MPDVLSEKQQLVYNWIRERCLDGVPPSVPEVSAAFGMKYRTSAEPHVKAIRRKGWLVMPPGKERSMRLTHMTVNVETTDKTVTVATGGRVAMSKPAWIDWLKQELALAEGKL